MNNPLCPPIPRYLNTPEDSTDPLFEQYPLQLLTPHPRNRVHSELYKVEWLREVEPHRVWINPADAKSRGMKDEDAVHLFNARGKVAIKVWVTERIIPGVISLFEGTWYSPDERGIDRGACANTLTKDAYSGGGAAAIIRPKNRLNKARFEVDRLIGRLYLSIRKLSKRKISQKSILQL